MMKKDDDKKELKVENWILVGNPVPDSPGLFVPTIQGIIDGKEIKTSVIYWLDTKDKIAMTKDKIYHLGDPDQYWMLQLEMQGHKLSDVDVKGVVH